ncbi:hypothetical protein J7426_14390 [Tropicibacter sp. R16_0]|uniref:hypothetical protein n=1 Tax=Tropicibacter sp. R16_0 TaxID=2821102 RepID=UPI001ADD5450|nr:hypothetical protein [Tropicibacter sp. R16_0]MBO9451459.1 hypothetical protein [Tropicibacter sp. R16_0]
MDRDPNVDGVRAAFEGMQVIGSDMPEGFTQNDAPLASSVGGDPAADEPDFDGPKLVDGDEKEPILPRGFPVQPLGMSGGRFHFLTARGEKVELTAGSMTNRANLVALVTGVPGDLEHLAAIAPPVRRDIGFNAPKAADVLMRACSALPLFDGDMPIRHTGTWRASTSHPVVHLGESLWAGEKERRDGRRVAGALYPAVPSRQAPSHELCTASDLEWIRDRIQRFWNWGSPDNADILIGWIGQAALGQYPSWRTHCYIKGKHGSGKSTLLKVVSDLLGGMSLGVLNSTSAAALRQTTNRMAVARIIDEAEGSSVIEEVIATFRLMSNAEGAQVSKGTADHAGIKFQVYGAGLLASIIPGGMTPQDLSRFVVLPLGARERVENPEDQAMLLAELEGDAKALGPKVWARMLSLAPDRWDASFRIYNSLVQGLGGDARAGDTIGAILTGWDLMLFDAPLICPASGEAQRDRMSRARDIATPLVAQAKRAEEEGEAERFLRIYLGTYINKDHGGAITVAEVIEKMQKAGDDYDSNLLGRLAGRLLPGPEGRRDLFIANGANPQLNRAMAGTRWREGAHIDALDTHEEITKPDKPVRVAGRPMRGRIIPARFLPGYNPDPAKGGGETDDD